MLADTLHLLGYRPEDDSWDADGRFTYIHDENGNRTFLRVLTGVLMRSGWHKHPTRLRTFKHWHAAELIEIEPGGADCSGHYLHHMKAETVNEH